jgi:hypothetical protein
MAHELTLAPGSYRLSFLLSCERALSDSILLYNAGSWLKLGLASRRSCPAELPAGLFIYFRCQMYPTLFPG